MEYHGKDPRPYHGIGFFAFFLVLVPILTFILAYTIFTSYNDAPDSAVLNFSIMLAAFVGFCFNVLSICRGFIADLLQLWWERVKEFFEEVRITPKGAFKTYFVSFYHDGGIILAIFLLWMLACIVTTIVCFCNFYAWFQTL